MGAAGGDEHGGVGDGLFVAVRALEVVNDGLFFGGHVGVVLFAVGGRQPVLFLTGKDVQAVDDAGRLRLKLDVAGALFVEGAGEIGEIRLVHVVHVGDADGAIYGCVESSFTAVQIVHSAFQIGNEAVHAVVIQLFAAPFIGAAAVGGDYDLHTHLVGLVRRPAVVVVDVVGALRVPGVLG